jgi:hypothetical protein
LCHLWKATGGISLQKPSFGKASHTPSGEVPNLAEKRMSIVAFFSGCVRDVPKRSCVQVHPWWPSKKGKNFGQQKSTHAEIFGMKVMFSKKNQVDLAQKTRCGLTFSVRFFFHLWRTGGETPGHKTALGHLSHPPSGVVAKWVEKQPTVGPLFSAGVRDVPERSCAPVHPWWPPKKGKNFGQRKSTHAEILGTKVRFSKKTKSISNRKLAMG